VKSVLVVDAANVVGSVPDGWWKDRAGAARRLHEQLLVGDTPYDDIVLVLEGGAKAGVRPAEVARLRERGDQVVLISADHVLRGRCEGLGARAMSPSWLLDQIR
jgi:hypothetical protein